MVVVLGQTSPIFWASTYLRLKIYSIAIHKIAPNPSLHYSWKPAYVIILFIGDGSQCGPDVYSLEHLRKPLLYLAGRVHRAK